MSKQLLFIAFAVGLLAAACTEPPMAEVDLGSGVRFVPQVADGLNDAGVSPSVVVDADGRPLVAYFSFQDVLEEEEIAIPRPIGSPTIPGVMLTTVADGIWTRGAIAIEKQIPNVAVAFNPAFDEAVADLTPQNVVGLRLAIDGDGGLHAVWGSSSGLFYAAGPADPAAGTQWTVEQVAVSPPQGLSLAVDDGGTPWISYYTSEASGPVVAISTKEAGGWTTTSVAPATSCGGCRTAIGATGAGPVVAFSDGGNGVVIVGPASTQRVDSTGGQGLSVAVGKDGNPVASYYAGDTVKVASGGTAIEVATVDAASASADGAGTSIAVDENGELYVAWFDAGDDSVHFATGDAGGAFTAVETGDATAGTSPSIAVAPDGSAAYLAWYEETNQDLLLGTYGDTGGLAFAQPSPTPGGVPSVAPPPAAECEKAQKGAVTVVAEGVAFVTSCIEVPAGQPFTIHFDDRDDAAAIGQHNVQIFPSATDLSNALFQGELVSGPATVDYDVPALDAGEYFFSCIIHPFMTGTVVAQ